MSVDDFDAWSSSTAQNAHACHLHTQPHVYAVGECFHRVLQACALKDEVPFTIHPGALLGESALEAEAALRVLTLTLTLTLNP